ncbi:protein NYNRIN-like [Chiloscyllium punctatum]|uniref:protein NYNRIN-like n=1 Tax=Chiloscyllium punctatum TaxID=137246 RepID=UPI003B6421A4
MAAPVLSLPDFSKTFRLFVNSRKGTALGVLTQDWGGKRKPVAFLSKILDPVSRGWPECVQAVAATAKLVEESRKLTFGAPLTVTTPHQVRTILNQKAGRWLTDSRILKYEAILLDREDLRIEVGGCQNPADFLWKGEGEEELEHCCSDIIEYQSKVREDLRDTPLHAGRRWYIDGSSRVIDGKRHNGYAVISETGWELVESGRLPNAWSAQTCELYALHRALRNLKGIAGTIYTDSKYAFGVVHTFGKIWKERGMINSRGKELVHEELVAMILEDLLLPQEIAVVHVKGHQKDDKIETLGNQLADEQAKLAGMGKDVINCLVRIPQISEITEVPTFTDKEETLLASLGGTKDREGKWTLPDGRQLLNRPLTRDIIARLHQGGHWGAQALCDAFLRRYAHPGLYTVAKQVTGDCITCRKINKRGLRQHARQGGRSPAYRPFEYVQVDYTELPPIGRLKYLLVVVDHLTGWVEAFPTTTATATQVSKILLEQIIPRFGLPRAIDSDQGSHFTSTVLQNVVQAMGIDWDLHTPWHPSSSGKVERMNQTIKKQLTKLTSEIGLPWTKCLPLALLQIRTQPRRDLGVSPFEMLFGLPFHGPKGEPPVFESRGMFVQKYVVALGSALSRLRQQGLLAQTPPLEFAVHTVKPGQWVLIKSWKQRTLEPTWDGPFLVLLTTETAVRTAEKGWTHYTRVKGPVPQPTEDERTSLTKASKEQRP